jgi:hypothetical protein
MRHQYETLVRLKILSTSLTPEEITKVLGIPCEKSWRIGDSRAHTIIKETTNGWVLGSGLPDLMPLEAQIETFLEYVAQYSDKIRTLSLTSTVELSCVVYGPTPPPLYLSNSVLSAIAQLGASLDIDLYILKD